MRVLKFLILLTALIVNNALSQSVSTYTFSQSSGTYTSITGTAAHTAAWDQAITSVTIPFTFYYGGNGYTSCNVSTNGFITFGATAPTTTNYTPISSAGTYSGAISACSFDLWSNSTTGGNIIYTTSGSSPNRIFIIQYTNVYRYLYGGPVNFQIRLSESTNVIRMVYGSCSETSTTNTTVQIGLRGIDNTDYNSRTLAANSAWLNNTTASTANTGSVRMKSTALPASGTTFIWTPPAPCTAPTAQATSYVNSSVASTSIISSFTAASPAPTGYLVVRSSGSLNTNPVNGTTYSAGGTLGNGTIVQAGSSTSISATSLTANTAYTFTIFSYNTGSCSGPTYYTTSPLVGTTSTCLGTPTSSAGSSISSTSFSANWSSVTSATGYILDVATDNAFTSMVSGYNGLAIGNVTTYSVTGLSTGTTYYYRVRATGSICTSTNSSTQTVTTSLINDDSGGAIALTINSSTTCTTTTTGTSIGATQTLVAQSGYGTADDDVWYKFTSTAASLDFSVSRGTIGDLVWELYNSSLVSLGAIDNYITSPETASLTGSTIGNVYYIRVYSYASTVGSRGTFTICITTPTQPPTNDNASGAITLIVNDPYITGTNDGATSSTTAPTPTGPSYYGGDVWYKVVVPSGGTVEIRTAALVLTDVVMEVYSGTASALTYITYNDDSLSSVNAMPYISLNGRTQGETIWIRVWDYGGDNIGTFKIKATTPIALPIGLLSFTGHNTVDGNSLEWVTASEFNNDYFTLERGLYRDGSVEWLELQHINGAGNSSTMNTYGYFDLEYPDYINYYQLTQTDYDGHSVKYEMISIDNRINKKEVLSMLNLLGQEINENYRGMVIITYVDGSIEKIIK
jgi:hypothetical protein